MLVKAYQKAKANAFIGLLPFFSLTIQPNNNFFILFGKKPHPFVIFASPAINKCAELYIIKD